MNLLSVRTGLVSNQSASIESGTSYVLTDNGIFTDFTMRTINKRLRKVEGMTGKFCKVEDTFLKVYGVNKKVTMP